MNTSDEWPEMLEAMSLSEIEHALILIRACRNRFPNIARAMFLAAEQNGISEKIVRACIAGECMLLAAHMYAGGHIVPEPQQRAVFLDLANKALDIQVRRKDDRTSQDRDGSYPGSAGDPRSRGGRRH